MATLNTKLSQLTRKQLCQSSNMKVTTGYIIRRFFIAYAHTYTRAWTGRGTSPRERPNDRWQNDLTCKNK